MATKDYGVYLPLRLSIETNSRAETLRELRKLHEEILDSLPTGVTCLLKDCDWNDVVISERN